MPPVSSRSGSRSRTRSSSRLVLIIIAAIVLVGVVAIAWAAATASAGSSQGNTAPEALLPDDTAMGVVELNVHDLPKVRAYYEDVVGLSVLEQSEQEVALGLDSPLIRLVSNLDGETGSTLIEAGLYHSAILYPDEASLAAVIWRIANTAPETFQGSADHAVSQAFYFLDPEGNGLELYVDRPSAEWQWNDGEVQMGSAALDPNAFIQQHLKEGAEKASEATMGHVHLKVGDLDQARDFYADTLGFAVTAEADGALFYAAGGYHHHVATNIWQSAGAGDRENWTGLRSMTITVPEAELGGISERIEAAGHDHELTGDTLSVQDPWGNTVFIVGAAA